MDRIAIAKLVLEYLKVLLSAPVLAGATTMAAATLFRAEIRALIGRIAHVKFGGSEFFTSQQNQTQVETTTATKLSPVGSADHDVTLPAGMNLPPAEAERIQQMLRSARSIAHLWEYRYLNFFLVRATQAVLTWLASRPPLLVAQLDAEVQPFISRAEERKAIISALENHHLISIDKDGLVEVTPKGREYLEWRGPLPQTRPEGLPE